MKKINVEDISKIRNGYITLNTGIDWPGSDYWYDITIKNGIITAMADATPLESDTGLVGDVPNFTGEKIQDLCKWLQDSESCNDYDPRQFSYQFYEA